MERHSKAKKTNGHDLDNLQKEVPTEFNSQNLNKSISYQDAEKELNSNILKITMKIMEQYPELSIYLDEMPVTIPNEKNPDISLKNLQLYLDSLNSLLIKYILEHRHGSK